MWKHYYNNNDALIFVIDSNDPDRIEEARDELHGMLSDDQLRDTTVLILANKQDLPCAMNVTEVTEKLGMSNFRNRKVSNALPQVHHIPFCGRMGEIANNELGLNLALGHRSVGSDPWPR